MKNTHVKLQKTDVDVKVKTLHPITPTYGRTSISNGPHCGLALAHRGLLMAVNGLLRPSLRPLLQPLRPSLRPFYLAFTIMASCLLASCLQQIFFIKIFFKYKNYLLINYLFDRAKIKRTTTAQKCNVLILKNFAPETS